jgi:transposase
MKMSETRKNKIKQSIQNTKDRRNPMTCKVIECKIDISTLSNLTVSSLNKLFVEGKWLYNSILASENITDYDTKTKEVQIKVKDEFENRTLETISSQMKQGIKTRIFNSMSTLKALKGKGYKTGKLKFKSEIKCIPLKQHNNTFTILKHSKRIKIQGIKKPLKVNGLNQLPKIYEIGNANLVKCGKDFYVKITIFTNKEKIIVPDKSIGIDFGCETQLTLSNGEKIKYQFPISKRIKRLDKQLARKPKELSSKNRYKVLAKREKAYKDLTNKRNETKNQIVSKLVKNYTTICFQDESFEDWKQNGHGKKIQFSAMGGIISALKRKAVTPIVVDKWYPSTQICSRCGEKHKMTERERTYICQSCGKTIDRDVNASINIEKEGLRIKEIPMERRELKPVEIETSLDSFGNLKVLV